MTKFLLVLHVLVAIIAVGPVSVAASMFPPSARRALADPADPRAAETVRLLHRICRVYAAIGIAVPVLGFATGLSMGVLNSGWLIASMALTGIAAAVLLALVLPRQEEILEAVEARAGTETGTGTGTGTKSASGAAGAAGAEGGVTSRAATTATSASASDEIAANPRLTVQLAMFTGIFNLLWATVTILMIVRPGSTTGA
ncbi:protease [Streptomyces aurantiacus]|uniref:Membrane protein n=1 Tax=Streptomyces aurantiacus TaxID=47760 RepID=A0A7G1P970_9ACTN|nr:protease [Streptomyces aurantiacus]BCL30340.1 membrane protein [Streptomyces aurantiacus]